MYIYTYINIYVPSIATKNKSKIIAASTPNSGGGSLGDH